MTNHLMAFLNPEAIELQSNAKSNVEIIRILAGKLERLGYVKPSYVDAVVARELSLPTGLPLRRKDNVAVPHTDPEHVIRTGIAFATLTSPIPFGNMEFPDEPLPVGFVFLLAIDDKNTQIETLQQIMTTIQNAEPIDHASRQCVESEIRFTGMASPTRNLQIGKAQPNYSPPAQSATSGIALSGMIFLVYCNNNGNYRHRRKPERKIVRIVAHRPRLPPPAPRLFF